MSQSGTERMVFVYGTLLRGQPNHRLLHGARFVSRDQTKARFDLVDLGGFPAMMDGGKSAVVGEIYAVNSPTLAMLDRLEGHPHFYRREPICLTSGRRAETYVLKTQRVNGQPRIPSGDWRRHRKEELSCESGS